MKTEDVEFAKRALAAFLDNERDKGAEEGLAFEVAESLLDEACKGGASCLEGLPPIKKAILDHCVEIERQGEDDLAAQEERGG
jgi:hypothetical protein